MTITPVLLAGGSGTRLWPLSRQSYPKQFSPILGSKSLFQATALRLSGNGFAAPLVVTAEPFRFIATEQLAQIDMVPEAVLIEPYPRNTAPAVAAAALALRAKDPGALMLIAPTDHVVPDAGAFRSVIFAAADRAAQGDIVTFGITPTRPETGYGYLQCADGADPAADTPQPLLRLVEKPDAAEAAAILSEGGYLWNAGVFLASVATILEAYEANAPDILSKASDALAQAETDLGFTRLAATPWEGMESVSIDYAIMEKARNLAVMPYSGGWSDLGAWDTVWQEIGPDASGTAISGPAHAIDCRDTLLRSETEGQAIVGIGLEDIIAVAMPDAVLVTRKSMAQRAKDAVEVLRAADAPQASQFPVDHRPWGSFESLVTGPRFQVKRIVVNPGGALSLQSHHHRAEHWIVVAGTAQVTVDGEVSLISENESIYIPLGAIHRLENPGKVDLTLIEVQTGSYLGEDDIIRYEDVYART